MNVDSFVDTNVLVYAAARDDEARRRRALDLIDSERFAVSAQVLQEFYVSVTRKLEVPLAPEQALEWIEQLEAFPCVSIDAALVKIAVETSVRYRIAYWDAAIIAAAQAAGAKVVFTEDLNHGQHYGEVQVRNPFVEPAA